MVKKTFSQLFVAISIAISFVFVNGDIVWSRGNETVLSIYANRSFTLRIGPHTWQGLPPTSQICTAPAITITGISWLGKFDELSFGNCTVRFYAHLDVFIFERTYDGSPKEPLWPNILAPVGVNFHALGWTPSYMLYGNIFQNPWSPAMDKVQIKENTTFIGCNMTSYINQTSTMDICIELCLSLPRCVVVVWTHDKLCIPKNCFGRSQFANGELGAIVRVGKRTPNDGPLFVFDVSANLSTLTFSPLDHFSTNSVILSGEDPQRSISISTANGPFPMSGTGIGTAVVPKACRMKSILLGRPGLKRATMALGAVMRMYHNTTRRRGLAVTELSYWDDNAAGYSFWSQTDRNIWGPPQRLFQLLKNSYAKQHIPIKQWELDPKGDIGSQTFTHFGWCYSNWTSWNLTLFPSGNNIVKDLLGNDSAVYYMSPFCNDTQHRSDFEFVEIGAWTRKNQPAIAETHPDIAYEFYRSILEVGKNHWNMEMLFLDFICFRGPHLQNTLPSYFEAGRKWLSGVSTAAMDLGIEVQYCMACPHQAMESLSWPSVTNARVNGDSGMYIPDAVYSSTLAAMLGLGWSKDNLRLIASSIDPSVTQGDIEVQTLFAALSLGPAGLADRLEGFPAIPRDNAAVVTNATLANSICAKNGKLLQPSFPLTPIELQLAGIEKNPREHRIVGESDPMLNRWATFTVVGNLLWFTVVSFNWVHHDNQLENSSTWYLKPSHLSPMIDCEHFPPPPFESIPKGAYRGRGSCLPNKAYVAWDVQAEHAMLWSEDLPFEVRLSNDPHQINIAPVVGGVAFLGEAHKKTAISTYRFPIISELNNGSIGLNIALQGDPGEVILLMYSLKSNDFEITYKEVIISANGTTNIMIP